jgi:Tol biopolymer transport system component/DNA-binding winged helix-turn-helix (wHTH) protein
MSLGPNKSYTFGDFRLDLDEAVLLLENTPLSLTPKAFHLLKLLVQNHGHIVDKDRLISEIWPDTFVEDGILAVNVALLRKVVGDDAAQPKYIETVARRGYRFVAEVSEISADVRVNGILQDTGILPRRLSPRLLGLTFGLLVVVLGSMAARSWYYSSWPFAASAPSAPILSQPFRSEQLTSSGNAGAAAISPNGKYVAFTDKNNGRWSIWLRQLATSENIPIAPPSDEVYGGLVFSWDGNLLFFVRGEPGKRLDIYRVSAFGGVPVKLIERAQGWISISPDNKEISFVRCLYEMDDHCSLFVADVDGKNERKLLTRPRPIRIADNQFSPDGRSIGFASGHSLTGSSEFGLAKIELESGRETEITRRKFFNVSSLKWMSNGSDLLVTARDKLAENNSVWKVSAVTGSVSQVTNDGANYAEFSLDQAARNAVAVKVYNDFRVWIASVDDPSNPKILADGEYASFTAEGKIVYQSNNSDIWTIDANGAERRQLTNDPLSDINPITSSNGGHIFFTSNRLGSNQVWRMNADGTDPRPISSIEGGYPRFATPDGKWVFYQSALNGTVRKVATDGSEEIAVPKIEGFAHAFSPDGRLLAYFFRDANESGKLKIGIRNLSDVALVRVLAYGEPNTNPRDLAWSSDNGTLYFISESNEKYSLWRTSLDQDKPSFVGGLGTENLQRFAISPDGKSILTIRGDWRHDAILITGFQ